MPITRVWRQQFGMRRSKRVSGAKSSESLADSRGLAGLAPALSHLGRDHARERFKRQIHLVVRAIADVDMLTFGLTGAHDRHVRDLAGMCITNLALHFLGPVIHLHAKAQ